MPIPQPLLLSALAALAALAGCVAGPRPSFDDAQPARGATGNAEVDAVLERLDAAGSTTLTAVYDITGASGDEERAAVVIADDARTSVTVGDTRYLLDGRDGITCDLPTDECEASLNDAHLSNLQITHEFYGPAFAQRLRVDADRRIDSPRSFTEMIADRPAVCVSVPVSGGDKVYCALDAGVLARYEGPDTMIELRRHRHRPDESRFETGG